jgi:alpha-tubulin suppressor-like RCC1 family protein
MLGNNSPADRSLVPVAVYTNGVLNGKTITQIAAGYYHTCALAGGQVYCWGYNNYGQLGNHSTTDSLVPVAVDTSGVLNGKTVTQITAGQSYTCALAGGQVFCWGYGGWGVLGNNSDSAAQDLVPVAVDTSGVLSGKTVTQIAAGQVHTCAIAGGQVFCWGFNSGQLGNNSLTDSSVPVAVNTSGVLSGKTVTQIAAGDHHTCALAEGKIYCWGDNANGHLGNNSTTDSLVPVAVNTSGVLSGKTVTQIAAGSMRTCAIAGGQVFCWGYNNVGQLGNNSTTQSLIPVAVDTSGVLNGKTITQISGSYYHTCALAGGQVFCWGQNGYGSLGNNSESNSSVPVAVTSNVFGSKCY